MVKKRTKVNIATSSRKLAAPTVANLLGDLRKLIDQARTRVAQQVNAELVMLYWNIGKRIRKEILGEERAEYGKQVLKTLAVHFAVQYGRGFSQSNLFDMVRFAEAFPDQKIFQTLSGKLGWSHFRQLIYIDDALKREFYTEMCRLECWSVRTLQKKIDGMLFERMALSKKPDKFIENELAALREEDRLTPDLVFQDPYLLDFLGLKDSFGEKDLESAILREMEQFLLELGSHFSFVARQKRIRVDNDDYYLDLLFFHRKLRRLVAIELKVGPFKPDYKGQMELYLRWLDKYERCEGEEAPVGLILCAGKSRSQQLELLGLDASDIRVAEFITDELPTEVLANKYHQAIKRAREQFASRQEQKKGQRENE